MRNASLFRILPTVAMGAPRQSFKRFVEVGRVIFLREGEDAGKLAVIVEIVDHNRAVIENPSAGVARQVFLYKNAILTPFVVKKLPRGAHTKAVRKAFDASDVATKWAESKWAKSIAARELRKQTTDFERFVIRDLKKQRRAAITAAAKKVQA
ncbi:hypothetical protein MCUN1_003834 [Malassezia cuniculi]|uniref:Large ribosomal subunit protein eL14 domain-containing protein n=1 Tax=Malassezia cuniculi TaxID=948313 RepID=A0AAF0J7S5_9BASI|nr:hypothetical protein MCUN1_003834 [Malassezia cuniculi]